MTTMALHRGVPAHLAAKGRHELIRHVMNVRAGIQKHKGAAKHAGKTVIGGLAASGGGALAGVAAAYSVHIPKTKIRTDLTVGALIGVAVAAGMFDEYGEGVGAFAHGMLGYGTGDVVKNALLAKGMGKAA